MPTSLGKNRYIYGLSKQFGDIRIVFTSSGLSNVMVKHGPIQLLVGVPVVLMKCIISVNMSAVLRPINLYAMPTSGIGDELMVGKSFT